MLRWSGPKEHVHPSSPPRCHSTWLCRFTRCFRSRSPVLSWLGFMTERSVLNRFWSMAILASVLLQISMERWSYSMDESTSCEAPAGRRELISATFVKLLVFRVFNSIRPYTSFRAVRAAPETGHSLACRPGQSGSSEAQSAAELLLTFSEFARESRKQNHGHKAGILILLWRCRRGRRRGLWRRRRL
jgi:hypothetical protein